MRNCPSQKELLAFHRGTLPEHAVDALAEHLEKCPDCTTTVRILEASGDPFFEALRHPSAEIFSEFTPSWVEQAGADTDTSFTVEVPRLQGYEILDTLGRGGMGVVYKARQQRLNRTVALKQLACKRDRDLGRASREAEALAHLQHPNIVQIFEIIEHEGRVYLALELVEGGTLSARVRGKPQPPEASAQLVETLAHAIHYAHLRGIVHRDLKPSNVLLARSEAAAAPSAPWSGFIPKITDFGIAKQLSFAHGDTREGDVIGTPGYMAPEQAGGEATQVGPAADVYSLGVLLYELLTGRVPLLDANVVEMLLRLRNEEPVSPRRLVPRLPRDLETICLKCLRKEPNQRYASAETLADDLHRFLSNEPIQARPTSAWERLRKWMRRHPAIAALMTLVLVISVLGFTLVAWQWRRAEDKAALALERERSEKAALLEVQKLVARNALSEGVNLCENGETARGLLWMVRSLQMAEENGDDDLNRAARCNLAAWQPYLVRRQADLPHVSWILTVAFSPDGRTLATGSYDETARLWDAEGKPLGKPLQHRFPVRHVYFSPDGKLLLAVSIDLASSNSESRIWDTSNGQLLASWPTSGRIVGAQINPEPPTCLTVSEQEAVVRSIPNGKQVGQPIKHSPPSESSRHELTAGCFSPDGKLVVTAGQDKTVRFWDAATGAPRGKTLRLTTPSRRLAFSPDGRILMTCSTDDSVRMWDAATGQPCSPLLVLQGHVLDIAFSPDGKIVATSSAIIQKKFQTNERSNVGGEVRLWRVPTGELLGPPLQHPHEVWSLAFSPKGRRLLTGCVDGNARLFLVATGELMAKLPSSSGNVTQVAFDGSGTHCLIADAGGGSPVYARLWQLGPEDRLPRVLLHNDFVSALKFSPDGRLLLSGGRDRVAQLWDVASGQPRGSPLRHKFDITLAAFSKDGRSLFTVCEAVTPSRGLEISAALWDLQTGRKRVDMHPPRPVRGAAFCDNGQALMIGDCDGNLRLHDPETGKPIAPSLKHGGAFYSLEFSPDEQAFLTGTDGGAVLWDWNARRQLKKMTSEPGPAMAYFYPDESGLLLVQSGFAQLWDRAGGAHKGASFFHAEGGIGELAFGPDSRSILILDKEARARLWDVATGKRIGPAPGKAGIIHIAFSPNGRHLAAAGKYGKVALWETTQPMQGKTERLRLWVEALAGMELDPQQVIHPLDPDQVRQRQARFDELGGPYAD